MNNTKIHSNVASLIRFKKFENEMIKYSAAMEEQRICVIYAKDYLQIRDSISRKFPCIPLPAQTHKN